MTAGELGRARVVFQKRSYQSDGYGNSEGDFFTVFERPAEILARVGGETIQAARLAGKQPYTIKVRYDSQTSQLTTDFRCQDVESGTVFNIRAVTPLDNKRRWLELLCDTGVAT